MLVNAPAPSDAFGRVAEDCGAAAELFAKTGPTVGKLASRSAVAASAVIAGALMPGPLAVAALGAVAGGGLTRFTVAPTLVEGRYRAMQAKIAGLLRDGATAGDWTSVTAGDVAAVVAEYDLPGAYATALLCQIYTKYLLEVMRMPEVKTAEMNDLSALREILGMDAEAVGNAHYDVAVDVYRELQWTDAATLEDGASAEFRTVSKLLFLSDRAFAGSGASVSDEAYGYEVGRVRSVFALSDGDVVDRCSSISAPFYERALAGTVEKLDDVTPDMLDRARAKLGITAQTAKDAHLATYLEAAESALARNGEKLTDGDDARLEKLASVLAVDAAAAAEALASLTVPLYVAATREAVESGIGADEVIAAALGATLEEMRVDLRLTAAAAGAVFKDAIKDVLAAPYKAATDACRSRTRRGPWRPWRGSRTSRRARGRSSGRRRSSTKPATGSSTTSSGSRNRASPCRCRCTRWSTSRRATPWARRTRRRSWRAWRRRWRCRPPTPTWSTSRSSRPSSTSSSGSSLDPGRPRTWRRSTRGARASPSPPRSGRTSSGARTSSASTRTRPSRPS